MFVYMLASCFVLGIRYFIYLLVVKRANSNFRCPPPSSGTVYTPLFATQSSSAVQSIVWQQMWYSSASISRAGMDLFLCWIIIRVQHSSQKQQQQQGPLEMKLSTVGHPPRMLGTIDQDSTQLGQETGKGRTRIRRAKWDFGSRVTQTFNA